MQNDFLKMDFFLRSQETQQIFQELFSFSLVCVCVFEFILTDKNIQREQIRAPFVILWFPSLLTDANTHAYSKFLCVQCEFSIRTDATIVCSVGRLFLFLYRLLCFAFVALTMYAWMCICNLVFFCCCCFFLSFLVCFCLLLSFV